MDFSSYRVKTDEQGGFAFSHIPPGDGEIVRLIKTSPNSWSHSHNTPVRVQPGKITQVTLGDSGAVLTGRIRFESPPPEVEKLTLGGNMNSVMPSMPRNFATPAETQAFVNSPEWQAQVRAAKRFSVVVAADGSFTMDSIPPGNYTLRISASKPGNEAWNSVPVASGTATITVPEGADPKKPIRLDEILLRPTSTRSGP